MNNKDAKEMKPKRPMLRYHGGKWMLADWIISYFPKHRVYVEPNGGSCQETPNNQSMTTTQPQDLITAAMGALILICAVMLWIYRGPNP